MARPALRLAALFATWAIVAGMAAAPPAGARPDLCSPPGQEAAVALPGNLANAKRPREDKYTTAGVEPLSSIDVTKLGLGTPGVLTVGTLTESPPTNCITATGRYSGFDNELLRAIAKKLGLRIQFVGTDFFGLLAQVESGRFDVGSASINATEERRRMVGFTNGYDFGYMALVVPAGSGITGFDALARGQRIAVVQGTVEDAYAVDTLEVQPVRFPDSITLYASLKSRQVDAWVAPSLTALNLLKPGDPAQIIGYTFTPAGFEAYAVAKRNQALISALNAGLDAVIDDGTWPQLFTDWVPRPLPPDWQPGSKSAATPHLPDFAAIAARHHRTEADQSYAPKSTLAQLRDSFFDWHLYRRALPELIKTGLPNTLLLTVSGGAIGLVAGLGLAVAGISRSRWLRWPARVYTDIFRGLPEVLIILLIGLAVGPLVSGLTHNNPYPLGIAALGLTAAAYIGEILRSGIQSVEAGQLEASRALGFGYPAAMRLVVIPQGIRRVLPALVNQFIALLKASALLYFLGLVAGQRELFQVARDYNAQTGSLSPLVAAGLLYLALTIPLTHLVNVVDQRLRRGRPADADDSVELRPAISSQEMT
ncbi:amino acid ABC transporter permease [Mycolicibacter engbaekii]|uniref:Amino acid ABC transporter permease n=1 Tax=Mycolicibacter engbaekii TaxID=188915 RepID=A0A1X1TNF2_9MYCO|nr:ABC transporter substrate-binding protein/permease [Mycolicibacter engbaekii]ORV46008.1 amino acid ABC transporter permease [Mycolicibacter engbaekii]